MNAICSQWELNALFAQPVGAAAGVGFVADCVIQLMLCNAWFVIVAGSVVSDRKRGAQRSSVACVMFTVIVEQVG
jgi:hypothetical protein